jgi:hypothetical protein
MMDDEIEMVITPETKREIDVLGIPLPAGVRVSDPAQDDPSEDVVVVCCRKGAYTAFTDNIEGVCSTCNAEIFSRPHVPSHSRKLCTRCAANRDWPA